MSTMQEAASAIVALINSKPTSPTQAEIEAVLAKVATSGTAPVTPLLTKIRETAASLNHAFGRALVMSLAHAEHYREWRHMIEAHVRTFGNPCEEGMTEAERKAEEARMEESLALISAVADKIIAEPVRAWGDLLPCAEVYFWCQWPGVDPHGPDAIDSMEAGPNSEGPAIDRAVDKRISGIFALAGVGQFGRDSRARSSW